MVSRRRIVKGESPREEGKIFGPHLRQLRLARGLTQSQLADLAGTNTMFISKLERGVTTPTIGTLVRLGRALRCTVTELVAILDRDDSG
jgi:transcriptional regulator with XRE-family HTH domain